MAVKNLVGDTYTDDALKNLQAKIDEANERLQNFNTTAVSDEDLRKQAQSEYTPIYNAQVAEQEAAKQSAKSALDSSMSAIERQYGRDSEELGRAYDTQAAAANNSMLARGFNNSSLAAAMSNYVNTQRNRALANLTAERTAAESNAQAAYNNAVSAADAAIGRLGSDLASNVDARLQALKQAQQSQLFQQIQAQNALEQYKTELMLQMEQLRRSAQNDYYANYGTGRGSSGSSSSSSAGAAVQTSSAPSSSLGDKFNQSNQGSGAISSAVKSVSSGISSGISSLANSLSNLFSKTAAASKPSNTESKAKFGKNTFVR